jgi:antitoxin Phd
VPNEHVVEVIEFETTDPALRGEMTITTTLVDANGGTEIRAVHDGLPTVARRQRGRLAGSAREARGACRGRLSGRADVWTRESAYIDCLVHIGHNRHMKTQAASMDTGSGSSVGRRRRARPDRVAAFRNSRGETLEPSSVTASEAKSEFGRVLEMAIQGGAVVITKHDAPKAVLISVENFNALSGGADTRLDTLNREFDALLAGMQTPKARRGMKTAFAASGKQLGKAAVAAARRRG